MLINETHTKLYSGLAVVMAEDTRDVKAVNPVPSKCL